MQYNDYPFVEGAQISPAAVQALATFTAQERKELFAAFAPDGAFLGIGCMGPEGGFMKHADKHEATRILEMEYLCEMQHRLDALNALKQQHLINQWYTQKTGTSNR